MAKRPRPKSFNDSRLRGLEVGLRDHPKKGPIADGICRSLVRGLLIYFSSPERRKDLDKIFIDVIEDALLDEAQRLNTELAAADDINVASNRVHEMINELLKHPSYDVLAEEIQRLLPLFETYPYFDDDELRKQDWLRVNVLRILAELFEGSKCQLRQATTSEPGLCHRRKDVPGSEEIREWSKKSGTLQVLFHILAYHHGSTYDTVKEHYERPQGRRSPSNKGPQPPKRKSRRILIGQKKKGSPPRVVFSDIDPPTPEK